MFRADVEKAKVVAERLLTAKANGLFDQPMPEDRVPFGVLRGTEVHLTYVTLSCALNYQRDAAELWTAAAKTFEDPTTDWVFYPADVLARPHEDLIQTLQTYGLSQRYLRDASFWERICRTLTERYDGKVSVLVASAHHDAEKLLELVVRSYRVGKKEVYDFPSLRGPKISPMWVRILADTCHVRLQNLESVPLPVDVHTAQATLQLGLLKGDDRGKRDDLRRDVQLLWREVVPAGSFPLQLDGPLWLLSERGCRSNTSFPCFAADICPVGDLCEPEQIWLSVTGEQTGNGRYYMVERKEPCSV